MAEARESKPGADFAFLVLVPRTGSACVLRARHSLYIYEKPGADFGFLVLGSNVMARHAYLDLVAARASAPALEWLLPRCEKLNESSFELVYSGAGRRLGSAPFEPSPEELKQLSAAGLPVPHAWPLSAVGRAALLCLVCEPLDGAGRERLARSVFKTGDNEERSALLKSLPLLPGPEAFLELAIDACRSHVQDVFEAIACENAYPSRHFPEHNFNQMVLKGFFTGMAIARIEGLASRRTPELVRMAEAYASERRAAGRAVPADLALITGAAAPASVREN
jgi:hypothetical protein